jgi:uncharacterized protein (DUF736 family)
MAIIGTFQLKDGKFTGAIETLTLKAKLIFLPEDATGENAPNFRIYAGRCDVGAAWRKVSAKGLEYLSVKLDSPSFERPLYASLYADDKVAGNGFQLVWNRPTSKD